LFAPTHHGSEGSPDLAAAVADEHNVRVEDRHQRGEVSAGGSRQEGVRNATTLAGIDLDSGCAVCDVRPRPHGELADRGRGSPDHGGHVAEGQAEQVVEHPGGPFGGPSASSATMSAKLTRSSRVTRSAGSAVEPPGRPLIHSVRSGSGSGIHSPT
jgi:hypothetical protein